MWKPRVVLMGPAGAGKTTVGRRLAERLGVPFEDADDYHDAVAIERMRAGIGLDDSMRAPWLERLSELLERRRRQGVVLACSALKRRYRVRLGLLESDDSTGSGQPSRGHIRLVHLRVPRAELARRLRSRAGHYAGAELLDGQLTDLEPPQGAIEVDGTLAVDALVLCIAEQLVGGLTGTSPSK